MAAGEDEKIVRSGEYERKGDYHKELDKNWKYYPIYKCKIEFFDKFIKTIPTDSTKIVDVGCGEGVLVEKLKKEGYNIIGIDMNYSSENIVKSDITKKTQFKDSEFDLVLCLDVIEHLTFDQQKKALTEMNRILKKGGTLFLTVPNLAHFLSRISFLLTGKFLRTSQIERHPGDRPISEFVEIVKNSGFKIRKRSGLFPTFPLISLLTYFSPANVLFLHKIVNRFFSYPNYCFLNLIICEKKKEKGLEISLKKKNPIITKINE